MSNPEVVIHGTPELLAATTAARLVTKLVDIQSSGRIPAIALTGGGVGTKVLAHLNASPARDAIDWSRVEIFWGDERFVPVADPDRNEKQAREALLDHIRVDPARVHPMAASDGEFGSDVDAAAAAYGDIIDGRDGLDLVMLGMGDEGHVASVFPESPAVYDTRPVVAVRNCPKPPPTRISLTLPTIRRASEVWIITAAASKAGAVAMALGGAGEVALPAAGATGRSRTLWLLDRASASALPAGISRAPVS
jgi:6-phosphogluconolactonase